MGPEGPSRRPLSRLEFDATIEHQPDHLVRPMRRRPFFAGPKVDFKQEKSAQSLRGFRGTARISTSKMNVKHAEPTAHHEPVDVESRDPNRA